MIAWRLATASRARIIPLAALVAPRRRVAGHRRRCDSSSIAPRASSSSSLSTSSRAKNTSFPSAETIAFGSWHNKRGDHRDGRPRGGGGGGGGDGGGGGGGADWQSSSRDTQLQRHYDTEDTLSHESVDPERVTATATLLHDLLTLPRQSPAVAYRDSLRRAHDDDAEFWRNVDTGDVHAHCFLMRARATQRRRRACERAYANARAKLEHSSDRNVKLQLHTTWLMCLATFGDLRGALRASEMHVHALLAAADSANDAAAAIGREQAEHLSSSSSSSSVNANAGVLLARCEAHCASLARAVPPTSALYIANALVCAARHARRVDVAEHVFRVIVRELSSASMTPMTLAMPTAAEEATRSAAVSRRDAREAITSPADVVLYTSMLNAYISCDQIEDAWNLFHEMRQNNVQPDEVTFTTMIRACVARGEAERAINLYEEMEQIGLQPTEVSFSALLAACASRHEFANEALILFERMQAAGYLATADAYVALARSAAKAGDVERAEEIVKRAEDDEQCEVTRPLYMAALSAYARAQLHDTAQREANIEAAERAFERLVATPPTAAEAAPARGESSGEHETIAIGAAAHTADGKSSSHAVATTANETSGDELFAASGAHESTAAIALVPQQSIQATHLNALLAVYTMALRLNRAASFVEERYAAFGVKPDVATFTSLIQMYGHARRPKLALDTFERMQRVYKLRPDYLTYTATVYACARSAFIKSGERVLCEMLEAGHLPHFAHIRNFYRSAKRFEPAVARWLLRVCAPLDEDQASELSNNEKRLLLQHQQSGRDDRKSSYSRSRRIGDACGDTRHRAARRK